MGRWDLREQVIALFIALAALLKIGWLHPIYMRLCSWLKKDEKIFCQMIYSSNMTLIIKKYGCKYKFYYSIGQISENGVETCFFDHKEHTRVCNNGFLIKMHKSGAGQVFPGATRMFITSLWKLREENFPSRRFDRAPCGGEVRSLPRHTRKPTPFGASSSDVVRKLWSGHFV